MDRLAEFLRAAASRDFRLGEWDCGLWLADWFMAATGKSDPASALRGRIYEAGDLERHLLVIVACLGLARTETPARGDIGLLRLQGAALGAICLGGGRWAVLGKPGLSSLPARPVAAWKLNA